MRKKEGSSYFYDFKLIDKMTGRDQALHYDFEAVKFNLLKKSNPFSNTGCYFQIIAGIRRFKINLKIDTSYLRIIYLNCFEVWIVRSR